MVNKKTFPYELIGQQIVVVESTNKFNEGVEGKIVDETKMTIKVEQQGKIKILLKNTIKFKLIKTGIVIDGRTVVKRSEDRTKG
jgi:ribonuclease P protein subunit POP4